jgi:uncharacterized protein Yka (UPF0111/DUF47 family)
MIGFERPPALLITSFRAAAAEVAAAAGTLALLEAAPRSCAAVLDDLGACRARAETHIREILGMRSIAIDRSSMALLTTALADIADGAHDAAAWWCRAARCEPDVFGLAGMLRDTTRALADAIEELPDQRAAEAAVGIHRRVAEGRRMARRARAAAIDRGELREVLGRLSAIAAVEGSLAACGRAAGALQRLAA